jgi:hypothetical protein
MILWGVVAAAMAAVNTPSQLLAIRFVLGVVEAGFSASIPQVYERCYIADTTSALGIILDLNLVQEA